MCGGGNKEGMVCLEGRANHWLYPCVHLGDPCMAKVLLSQVHPKGHPVHQMPVRIKRTRGFLSYSHSTLLMYAEYGYVHCISIYIFGI